MKRPTVGETDKLRALTEDPELRALMEQIHAAPPEKRGQLYQAFNEKADALYPDWRETLKAAGSDGRIVRAIAIHCVLRIRARSDLDELERFAAKTAEADFVSSFDEVTGSPNASAAFRMTLAFHELMRIAKLDPDEMAEIARQLRKDIAAHAGSQPKTEKDWVQPVLNAARRLFKHDPFMKSQPAANTIKETMGENCPDVRWVAQLIRNKRDGNTLPLRQLPPTTRPTRRR
jgi:DNA-binding Lrp family transcriptional regulator